MKVSGCIVTYNNIDVIEDCIKSILQYTRGVDFKLYIVDNGSTDGTKELIRKKYGSVTLIENDKNMGFGEGHNRVLPLIDSKYHVIINPDIRLDSDTVSALCRFMEQNETVAMVTPRILNEDKTEQYLPKYCPTIRYVIISKIKPFRYLRRRYTRQEECLEKPTKIEFATGCFSVVRTKLFQELAGFDDRFFMYCEDADLSRRIRKKGYIVFYPQVSVIHRWERENTRSLKGVFRFMSSLTKYFFKWGIKF
ncbi:MAG: glycosyltransferase family 2 protein [Muribaculaceae bacterium]|nr:glycosyltransferase family 2 protein [Muribaculaceae bacterium]MCM1398982.1 glycosyltransferase family 2 protein [Clostridium sp.]MCM1458840.1 glycosyltransferase family 2 protein [Bacteroides sp.]